MLSRRALERRPSALAVSRRLRGKVFGRRDIKLIVEDRVSRRIFVHIRGAMPDPLPCNKDRKLDVVLDLAHLERRRMTVPHQIVDESLILADLAGSTAVGDAGRL